MIHHKVVEMASSTQELRDVLRKCAESDRSIDRRIACAYAFACVTDGKDLEEKAESILSRFPLSSTQLMCDTWARVRFQVHPTITSTFVCARELEARVHNRRMSSPAQEPSLPPAHELDVLFLCVSGANQNDQGTVTLGSWLFTNVCLPEIASIDMTSCTTSQLGQLVEWTKQMCSTTPIADASTGRLRSAIRCVMTDFDPESVTRVDFQLLAEVAIVCLVVHRCGVDVCGELLDACERSGAHERSHAIRGIQWQQRACLDDGHGYIVPCIPFSLPHTSRTIEDAIPPAKLVEVARCVWDDVVRASVCNSEAERMHIIATIRSIPMFKRWFDLLDRFVAQVE